MDLLPCMQELALSLNGAGKRNGNLGSAIPLSASQNNDVFRKTGGRSRRSCDLRPPVPREIGVGNHNEEIDVAIGSRLSPGMGTKKINAVRIKAAPQPTNDFICKFIQIRG